LPQKAPVCQVSSPHAQIAASSSRNAVNFSSARTMKRFPSRCASAIQIVRHSVSTAKTQPKLDPRFLRLLAMISQYFTSPSTFILVENTRASISQKKIGNTAQCEVVHFARWKCPAPHRLAFSQFFSPLPPSHHRYPNPYSSR
jgi:hypothetical protein